MKKRIIALLLVLVMAAGLCACGGTASAPAASQPVESTSSAPAAAQPAAQDAPKAEEPKAEEKPEPGPTNRRIGGNQFVVGTFGMDSVSNFARHVTDICGDELVVANDEGNIEKMVNDVENYVSAGVDAVFWLGFVETNFAVGPQKMEAAGMPFALPITLPRNEEVTANIEDMEMFAGGIGSADYDAGVQVGKWAAERGYKKALISAGPVGDATHDPRVNGFTDAFTAGGGEVIAVARVPSPSEITNITNNLVTANLDADFLLGAGADYGLAGINAREAMGADLDVACLDITPDLLAYLKDGSFCLCGGYNQVASMFTMIMLENYLDGKPMKSAETGKATLYRKLPLIIIPAEMADLFERYFVDDFCYEDDEIKELLYRYNPDVTYEDIIQAVSEYSLENRLLAKYKAGKVTAEELAAVGINVD